jgi:hypothetical protein
MCDTTCVSITRETYKDIFKLFTNKCDFFLADPEGVRSTESWIWNFIGILLLSSDIEGLENLTYTYSYMSSLLTLYV